MKTRSAGKTIQGRRSNNEDALCARPDLGVFVVSDGMGGYEGGEVASAVTTATLEDFFAQNYDDERVTWPFRRDLGLSLRENLLKVAVQNANRRVRARRNGPLREMGATVVALAVDHDKIILGHVGDSRAYRLRDGLLEPMTRDHSFYEELLAQGASLPDDPEDFPHAHVITRAIGMNDDVTPDLRAEAALPGDVYLLCTDGLSGALTPAQIIPLLTLDDPEDACQALIQAAHDNGSRDNITAIVVRLQAATA